MSGTVYDWLPQTMSYLKGERSSKKGLNQWHVIGKDSVSFPDDPGSYLDHHHICAAAVCFNDFFKGTKTKRAFSSKEYRATMLKYVEWFNVIKDNWQYSVISSGREGKRA